MVFFGNNVFFSVFSLQVIFFAIHYYILNIFLIIIKNWGIKIRENQVQSPLLIVRY